eukprot:TRINITY_DN1537_c0_g1_i2.p1 TRINITY_DN1537_c0_g1~~TRINITY_DN1537_c0_g1_i2.p1  ORF type:complete len:502 (-),score=92.93 TRINITY_DN1537_c0_g1_i2:48-1553(-)
MAAMWPGDKRPMRTIPPLRCGEPRSARASPLPTSAALAGLTPRCKSPACKQFPLRGLQGPKTKTRLYEILTPRPGQETSTLTEELMSVARHAVAKDVETALPPARPHSAAAAVARVRALASPTPQDATSTSPGARNPRIVERVLVQRECRQVLDRLAALKPEAYAAWIEQELQRHRCQYPEFFPEQHKLQIAEAPTSGTESAAAVAAGEPAGAEAAAVAEVAAIEADAAATAASAEDAGLAQQEISDGVDPSRDGEATTEAPAERSTREKPSSEERSREKMLGKRPSKTQADDPSEGKRPSKPQSNEPSEEPSFEQRLHSALRVGKSVEEVEALIAESGLAPEAATKLADPQNGNQALHVAAQNGHRELSDFLLGAGADVNARNGKGQTPLHMSVEYDFFFQTRLLLEKGADRDAVNAEGHAAITGIDGGKIGSQAWDSPINMLRAAGDNVQELSEAFAALEAAEPSAVDQAELVQTGMQKRKHCVTHWDQTRFTALIQRF